METNKNPMERKIREIINRNGGEFRSKYFNNHQDEWHIICTSMDTIGDTTLAISDFKEQGVGKDDGERYLRLYSLLQAVFLQQDAIKSLYEVIKKSLNNNSTLKEWKDYSLDAWEEIRKYRNLSTGHPIKNTSYEKGRTKRITISRVTISDKGFQLLVFDSDNPESEFKNVNLEIIDSYILEAQNILSEIEDFLDKHRF